MFLATSCFLSLGDKESRHFKEKKWKEGMKTFDEMQYADGLMATTTRHVKQAEMK